MAGSLNRRSEGEDLEEAHEINVTPFIDVMLVLLIIFMIAAPLATVDVPVDLPGSTAQPAPRAAEPVYLTLQKDLNVALGDAPVNREGLGPALDAAAGGDRETRIYLRADESVDYGALMEVMNLLRAAGYLKIALVGLEAAPLGATPEAGPEASPETTLGARPGAAGGTTGGAAPALRP